MAEDDPRGVIDEAAGELKRLGLEVAPLDEEALERCINTLPEVDRMLLHAFRAGKTHKEIAALLGLTEEAVLRSLARTYADIRMRMWGPAQAAG